VGNDDGLLNEESSGSSICIQPYFENHRDPCFCTNILLRCYQLHSTVMLDESKYKDKLNIAQRLYN
jgi:hypothetical protein